MSLNVLELTSELFDSEVVKSKKPVVVDFWAPWCGPCRMMSSVFEEIAGEMRDIKFVKVNVDENTILSSKFRIVSIPFFAFFKDGKLIDSKTGGSTKAGMIDWIKSINK